MAFQRVHVDAVPMAADDLVGLAVARPVEVPVRGIPVLDRDLPRGLAVAVPLGPVGRGGRVRVLRRRVRGLHARRRRRVGRVAVARGRRLLAVPRGRRSSLRRLGLLLPALRVRGIPRGRCRRGSRRRGRSGLGIAARVAVPVPVAMTVASPSRARKPGQGGRQHDGAQGRPLDHSHSPVLGDLLPPRIGRAREIGSPRAARTTPSRVQPRSSAPNCRSSASITLARSDAASSSVSVRSADWKATEKATDLFPAGIGGPR